MKYALLLNDMRSPNIENIQIVKIAETREELESWHNDQLADEPWRHGQWGKTFKKGTELEWFNPNYGPRAWTDTNDYFGGVWEVPEDLVVGDGLYKCAVRSYSR